MAAGSIRRNIGILVIDADVARAAGDREGTTEGALACMRFLNVLLLETELRAAFCDKLREEWDRHASRSANGWRRRMYARRRIDDSFGDLTDSALRNHIGRCPLVEGALEAVLKDLHLIECARRSGAAVSSCDERVRGHLRTASATVGELRDILRDGAPVDIWCALGIPLSA